MQRDNMSYTYHNWEDVNQNILPRQWVPSGETETGELYPQDNNVANMRDWKFEFGTLTFWPTADYFEKTTYKIVKVYSPTKVKVRPIYRVTLYKIASTPNKVYTYNIVTDMSLLPPEQQVAKILTFSEVAFAPDPNERLAGGVLRRWTNRGHRFYKVPTDDNDSDYEED